jgi:hypothetical protein
MDGGWTENTFSFNSCFQVNQCLISFVFVFVFFLKAKIGILATKKKKPMQQLSCKGILLEKMTQILPDLDNRF